MTRAEPTAESARAARIAKPPPRVPPNLADHAAACAGFDWAQARRLLDGLPAGGLNIGYEAVDRHLAHGRGPRTAIRWLGKAGARRELSYAELAQGTNRFANAVAALGVQPGERVFVLMGRLPELYLAVLGALKARCAVSPLFSAFGPEPIATRCEMGDARVLVTTPELYQRKIKGLRARLPGLQHVIVVGDAAADEPGVARWADLVDPASPDYTIGPTDPETMALLHFTSGTTGRPKGAIHVHGAVVMHALSARDALDLQDDDVFWCTADPGWVTGTSYGIVAPLVRGVTNVVVEAEFDAPTWYGVLERERVSVWYTAPTAIRMMMRLGADALRGVDLSALRFMASVGEPLNPEAVWWGLQAFGLPFHDNWWQTETGGIMIATSPPGCRPGSMGRPLPSSTATADVRGEPAEGAPGRGSMRDYLNEPERYRKCFAGGWYRRARI
jgi:acetyl-CoA synthetase